MDLMVENAKRIELDAKIVNAVLNIEMLKMI